MDNNLAAIDVETGGLDYKEHCITQIGVVIVQPSNFKVLAEYDRFVKPYGGLSVTEEALKTTRVSLTDIENGESIDKIVPELIALFRKYNVKSRELLKPILVGHNFRFDRNFLVALFQYKKQNFFDHVDPNCFDTKDLMMLKRAADSKSNIDISRLTLSASCESMGIKFKAAHGALSDAHATIKLLAKLTTLLRISSTSTIIEEKTEEKRTRSYFQF